MDYKALDKENLIELLEERDSKIEELEQELEDMTKKKEELKDHLDTIVSDGKQLLRTIEY